MNFTKITHDFFSWLQRRGLSFDDYTSEFTIQFRLAVFLENYLSKQANIQLEVNTRRFGLQGMVKSEIDICIIFPDGSRHAIELKYLRDPGTYNIGMFSICEDIRFLEQLRAGGFASGCSLSFSNLKRVYQSHPQAPVARNLENQALHTRFRHEQRVYGELQICTGTLNKTLTLQGRYDLAWQPVTPEVQALVVQL